ncbi:folylpolyglutamate synthase/dihydrofolate synthase family protein [soil metagenome]
MLNYSQTVDWMFQQLPMYQRVGATAYKKDHTNILLFSEKLKNPHNNFKSIHVAGTNGKGSVSHMLASVFQEAGYKVGLYTSPHLKDYRERIKVNGQDIPKDNVVEFINRNKIFLEQNNLSFFEMSVGMAFDHFSSNNVDIAIIEVGLGGRLDSTNIISPLVSVITNIGLDHTQMLGNSLAEIAAEKAGIIKPGIPVFIGEIQEETQPVFNRTAEKQNADIQFAEEADHGIFESDLKGDYQVKNIRTALAVLHSNTILNNYNITASHIQKGLQSVKANTGLRGRWEILGSNPKIICDTAHNAEGLIYAMRQLSREKYEKLHIVIGVVNDKDLDKILPLFPAEATYYFCKPDVPRGMEAGFLKEHATGFKLTGDIYSSVSKAYEKAKINAGLKDVIYIGGSTFTVAEII